MIEFKDVDFTYENGQMSAGVHGINLSIPQGQVVLICGESGCGKTTLTRMLNGLIPHFYEGELKGKVSVCGKLTADCELYELAPCVGSVFQNPKSQFYTVKTDTEIVFACENVGMEEEQILANMEDTVKELEVSYLLGRSLFSLSGGEKQKIACASVAALRPSIIAMDEPTSNLDMKTISDLKMMIRKWKQAGKTVVIAEHRLYWLTDLADRVIYMKDGRIKEDISMDRFRQYSCQELHQRGLRNAVSYEKVEKQAAFDGNKIEFERFCFSYPKARTGVHSDRKEAMNIESLAVPKGAIVGILGNNGAGKTTFGRCLCGLEKRAKGRVVMDGNVLSRKKRIGLSYIVMQDVNHQLFTESVFDEVLLSMEKSDDTPQEKEQRTLRILRQLKLMEYKDCHPMSLSGGQKQRVAIASALASDKELLLYDEPTSGLDYKHMLDVAEAIQEMKGMGKTQFIITHDAELTAHCCDFILLFKDGKIIKSGCADAEDVKDAVTAFWEQFGMERREE